MPRVYEHTLRWADMWVGQDIAPPYYHHLTAEEIKYYTENVLADHDHPLYTDEEFAKKTKFGGIVAPPAAVNYYASYWWCLVAANKLPVYHTMHSRSSLEFFRPARAGDTLTAKMCVAEKYTKNNKTYITWRIEVTNAKGELVVRKFHTSWFFGPNDPGVTETHGLGAGI